MPQKRTDLYFIRFFAKLSGLREKTSWPEFSADLDSRGLMPSSFQDFRLLLTEVPVMKFLESPGSNTAVPVLRAALEETEGGRVIIKDSHMPGDTGIWLLREVAGEDCEESKQEAFDFISFGDGPGKRIIASKTIGERSIWVAAFTASCLFP